MTAYSEKLSPAWWLVIATGLLVPATLLIFLPLNWLLGLAVGLALWCGTVGVLWFFAPSLRIEKGVLQAGKAQIELHHISAMTVFRSEQARHERGPGLDARAWLVLVPWIDSTVKIELSDPLDPTPYWLVSTRHPEAFAEAWEQSRKTT